jgi:hypothetical protein
MGRRRHIKVLIETYKLKCTYGTVATLDEFLNTKGRPMLGDNRPTLVGPLYYRGIRLACERDNLPIVKYLYERLSQLRTGTTPPRHLWYDATYLERYWHETVFLFDICFYGGPELAHWWLTKHHPNWVSINYVQRAMFYSFKNPNINTFCYITSIIPNKYPCIGHDALFQITYNVGRYGLPSCVEHFRTLIMANYFSP